MSFLRRFAVIAAALASAALAVPVASAGNETDPTPAVLIDRNAYPDDATAFAALQSAVDAGGNLILNGTFSLAAGQSLFVGRSGNDVAISGSKDGGTLEGGTRAIRQVGSVRMTLAGLRIRGPQGAHIVVTATSGTTVRDCVMLGLQRAPSGWNVGVLVDDVSAGVAPVEVTVEDNLVDAGDLQWTLVSQNSGVVVNNVAADLRVTLRGNRIQGAQMTGIFISDSAGSYAIEKNQIDLDGDLTKGPFLWAMGICGRNLTRAMDSFTVTNNDVHVKNSVAAIAYGSYRADAPQPPEVLVANNRVQIEHGVLSTLLMEGNVDGTIWRHNVVTGSAPNVVAMVPVDSFPTAEGNLLQQNAIEVALLEPSPHPMMEWVPKSHLYFGLGANNNLARGFEGLVVVDRGLDNIVR